jgi:2-polyprenyl-6-methoxyphenol hydroxylase-like FAD-dependent oxidoreductase
MKALIVGAGPGGLTAALWLARIGIDCEVFESAGEIRQLGVGINLLPHAVRELTILGLQDQIAASSVATAELAYYNKFGADIWREPRGIAAGYKWPQYSVLRQRFQKVLLDAALERIGADCLHTGRHLAAFTQDQRGVTARFVDRSSGAEVCEARGDILVGADGIHSVVRKYFYPDELLPDYCGRVLWRATSEAPPFLTGRSMIMAGYANCKFVAYPLSETPSHSGRVLINWVADVYVGADRPPVPRDWNRRTEKETVLRHFSGWKYDWLDIPALIEGAADVYEYPLVDRNPLPRWSFGRVTLLGDAAHPMYPIGSNGASQAILDSAALAAALAGNADPVAALSAYEQERLERTARLVLLNRQQGPEIVMQMVEERAPNGFTNLDDVITRAELEEVASRYKAIAGFDRERLNAMPAA